MIAPAVLFHYTCSHSIDAIRAQGLLRPRPHAFLDADLLWLTDLDQADRWGLGLTSEFLSCDRTEYRIAVAVADAEHWPAWARRNRISRALRDDLERYGLPMHWWVNEHPMPVAAIDRVAVTA